MMDKIHMTPNQKADRKWAKKYAEGKYRTNKRYYFPDTNKDITYTTVPQFNSIKECYKKRPMSNEASDRLYTRCFL